MGLLITSSRRHRYILVVIDYATRYPEVVPMTNKWVDTVSRELAVLFTWVGLPMQVVTGQRTAFMSKNLKATWQLAGVQPLRTSCATKRVGEAVQQSANSFMKVGQIGMRGSSFYYLR